MRGFMKTLEASIAIVFILVAVIALNTARPSYPEKDFFEIGSDCLTNIYNDGNLAHYAVNDKESSLKGDLDACLPPTISYDAKICSNVDCASDIIPSGRTVISVSRLVSGDSYEISPRLVKLWLWS